MKLDPRKFYGIEPELVNEIQWDVDGTHIFKMFAEPDRWICPAPTPSFPLLHQLRAAGDCTWVNKLQQLVFNTILVLQDFSLFLDLTYSSNIISITCILCKTVSSAFRTLVIT